MPLAAEARRRDVILIADDNGTWRKLMHEALLKRFPDAEFLICEDYQQAANVIKTRGHELTLVASDMDMKCSWRHTDGFQLHTLLKNHLGDQGMPRFIILSTSPLLKLVNFAHRKDASLVCVRKEPHQREAFLSRVFATHLKQETLAR